MASVSPLHVLIAIALSVTIVVLPMGHILMPLPWIVIVVVAWKHESKHDRGAGTFATYVAVTVLIVVAAIFAPVKTTEHVLDRPLALPSTELTIAEMDRETNFENAEWLPRYIYVTTTPQNADKQIRFRTTDITLREFVDTIESQTELRHRFMHCGNGSSILFGGDCCFGLRLR
ncbi:hypothetical protein [Allorhodopirellula heiligendammensis]|uniref:Uncharacterized protein n=1 Tax=Allorhodopirellula heiligendammensis TaxID=2714739 RepID=A0A5C6BA48_9BACT|nr:hypothetical protein [Allorhodopirellula heiligendammensis]TWU08587.1 hypothetical protein Poly21_55560 [Allorhodopirellula heiligendammensis]